MVFPPVPRRPPLRQSRVALRLGVPRPRPSARPAQRWLPALDYRAALDWRATLVRAVVVVDLLAIVVPMVTLAATDAFHTQTREQTLALMVALPLVWLAAMRLSRAHEARFLGLGSEEFKRVFNAGVRVAAFVAVVSFALHADISRGLVVVGLPAATLLDLLGRYAVRKVVHRCRRDGRFGHRVLVVGSPAGVADLATTLRSAPYAGMTVVGACTDGRPGDPVVVRSDLPTLGGIDDVVGVVEREGITALAVSATSGIDGQVLRRLTWRLEGTGVEILVAPSLTDCVGPRIHIRPLAGLPLLHIEEPQLSGSHRLLKGFFDRGSALLALLLLAVPLLVVAGLVRCTSRGPALFRQVRIGANGRRFVLYKFRTMVTDAEARLEALRGDNAHGEGPLFKMAADPRVTRFGAVLRRWSIDELPQLVNVLRGQMSLVGPRPPLPGEVAQYGEDVRRRLLVAPGLTGLWQVSGRSDLNWQESVRLDLYYVENWSLALDFLILWKTLPAVLRHTGAY